MSQAIQVLIIVLLLVGIGAVVRLFLVLGDVQKTLHNLEGTRTEITGTLQRLETVATTTEQLMREEVAPTLKVARETLTNVEITTRALAETTQAARRLVGKVEGAEKLLTLGGPVAKFVAGKMSGAAGGFLSGVGAGIRAVMGRKKHAEEPQPRIAESSSGKKLSAAGATNPVLPATEDEKKSLAAGKSNKRR